MYQMSNINPILYAIITFISFIVFIENDNQLIHSFYRVKQTQFIWNWKVLILLPNGTLSLYQAYSLAWNTKNTNYAQRIVFYIEKLW